MATFDPYHIWLGIPPEDQPPNHYRLLAIPELESDPDVIDGAAERQTIYLRTFQASDQAELAEKLLNEVSAARICLLSAEQKASYDSKLRQEQVSARSTLPEATSEMLDQEQASPTAKPVMPGPSIQSRSPRTRQRRKKVLPIGIIAVVCVAFLLFLFLGRGQQDAGPMTNQPPPSDGAQASNRQPALEPPRPPTAQPVSPQESQPDSTKLNNGPQPSVTSIQLLDKMRRRPEMLFAGMDWQETWLSISSRANEKTVTIPLPEMEDVTDYALTFGLQKYGRTTGVPALRLDFPISGGGHLQVLYYWKRTPVLVVQDYGETESVGELIHLETTKLNGHATLLLNVHQKQISVSLDDRLVGSFDTPQSKPGLASQLPNIRIWARAGSQMHFRVHTLDVTFSRNKSVAQGSSSSTGNYDFKEGLVAYYPFNGNANDESGNGNHGEVHGATFAPSRLGMPEGSVAFSNQGQIVVVPANEELNSIPSDTHSVCFWIRPNIDAIEKKPFAYLISRAKPGNIQWNYLWQYDGDRSKPTGRVRASTNKVHVPGNKPEVFSVDFDRWNHAVFATDASATTVFIDGEFKGRYNPLVWPIIPDIDLRIGGNGGAQFIGHLDDIRIYNRALSASEVKALYEYEKP